jgi:hypothetical protein
MTYDFAIIEGRIIGFDIGVLRVYDFWDICGWRGELGVDGGVRALAFVLSS